LDSDKHLLGTLKGLKSRFISDKITLYSKFTGFLLIGTTYVWYEASRVGNVNTKVNIALDSLLFHAGWYFSFPQIGLCTTIFDLSANDWIQVIFPK